MRIALLLSPSIYMDMGKHRDAAAVLKTIMIFAPILQRFLPTIASAPLILLTEPVPKRLRFLVKVLAKIYPKGSITTPIDSTRITNLPEEQDKHGADDLRHGTMSYPLAVDLVDIGKAIAKRAAEWNQPLLILHSKADQLTSYVASAEFSNAAKQAEFHGFETSQHEMHNDAPRDEIYALMTEFILRQASLKTT